MTINRVTIAGFAGKHARTERQVVIDWPATIELTGETEEVRPKAA
jgi:hypothetical protein